MVLGAFLLVKNTENMPIELVCLTRAGFKTIRVIYSWLFKYTQQHAAGFTENNWARTSSDQPWL